MKILISLARSPKTVRLYHGSNTDFKEFSKIPVNLRHVSLGNGHYLTTDKKMAEQYGKLVMVFDVDISNMLDWNNLTKFQRNQVEAELLKYVPKHRIAHFGRLHYEIIKDTPEGRNRFKELQFKTKNAYHEKAKAHVLDDDEIEKIDPSLLEDLESTHDVVAWYEAEDLSSANNEQLLTLMNEFRPDLAKELGYSSSKFGRQIAIYDSKLAKRVH